jgi:hypothetical protein
MVTDNPPTCEVKKWAELKYSTTMFFFRKYDT